MAITARLITESSITIMMNGKTYILTEDNHQHYAALRHALKVNDIATIETLIDMPKKINKYGEGKITVVAGEIMYGDEVLHNALTKRLLRQMDEGFKVEHMLKFLENLMKNPSKDAREELYEWIEANNNPITDDGCFIAFKRVAPGYVDHYTGKISNKVGDKPSMPREAVDNNRHNHCSVGLHFASESYLPHYHANSPGHTMVLKINPADVVSIPTDYSFAKGRCWQYEVIAELEDNRFSDYYKTSVYGAEPEVCEGVVHGHAPAPAPVAPAPKATAPKATASKATVPTPKVVYEVRSYRHSRNLLTGEVDIPENAWWSEGKRLTLDAARSLAQSAINQDSIDLVRIINVNDGTTVLMYEAIEEDASPVPAAPTKAWPCPTSGTATAPAPAKAPAKAPNPFEGLTFTKTQVCAILGVTMDVLDEMLEKGDKVERVTRGGKGFVIIK
jgi:hypothetical protein